MLCNNFLKFPNRINNNICNKRKRGVKIEYKKEENMI